MSNNYFDNASTTKMSEGALKVYSEVALTYYANPSSSHKEGRLAHSYLNKQREKTSSLLGIPLESVIYTSGASESNSIILTSLLWKRRKGRIVVSALEHPSISQFRVFFEERGFEWVYVKAPFGVIDTEDLTNKITHNTLMVISMLTHNVFGSIQPIEEIKKIIKQKESEYSHHIHFHVDCAQAIGKLEFSLAQLDCDSASMSAHKIEGPRGIGLLFLKQGSLVKPLSRGGNQEMGMRGGTENLPAISAFNYALNESITHLDSSIKKVDQLYKVLEHEVKGMRGVEILRNEKNNYVNSIVALSHISIPSEVITRVLDDKGFSISSTSACSNNSHSSHPFHPFITGFRPELLKGAFRISWNSHHEKEDIIHLCAAIKEITS